MKKYSIILVFISIGIASFFIACDKEKFEVNAPWKDIAVVYGLLNVDDTIQYVRINKMFLGDMDATQMAQIADSSNYPKLQVKVEELDEYKKNVKFTYWLDTITIHTKEAGTFYHPHQLMYYFNTKQNPTSPKLNPKRYYRIRFTKPNGEEVYGTTDIVEQPGISSPPYWDTLNPPVGLPAGQIWPTVSFKNQTGYSDAKVEWYEVDKAYLYEVKMRFYYVETINGSSTEKYIDFNLGSVKKGYDRIKKLAGTVFYGKLASLLEKNPSIERRAGKLSNRNIHIEVQVSAAAENLGVYTEVHQPSNSLVQERPEYTNLVNALGIFSSRSKKIQYYKLNPESEEELRRGEYTKELNFR